MRLAWTGLLAAAAIFPMAGARRGNAAGARQQPAGPQARTTRLSPEDLAIGGDLRGLPPGSTRYLTREDLLDMPQARYTVTDDRNFAGPVEIAGVALEELAQRLGAAPESETVIAMCNDKYRAHYARAYLAAHHPLLVLTVNGRPPADWPRDPGGNDMGPYLISHGKFTPSFKVLSHADEAQVPWGVVRLEFRGENAVFRAIAPRGTHGGDAEVQAGFRIAQQNCFRCHNMGMDGGQKAGLSWTALARLAATAPEKFGAYVRNPQAANAGTQMEGRPDYDDATLAALEAYFKTFLPQGEP